ncbi:hypothetical protein OC846_005867 [Tilletia horrida]|uniref:Uncharacterized protein n=1 Tax=Tilletia horrida TaxID=155126 RepID=A0AAN6JP42_9BASI|nr:hypothetical protein OC846_005867 [Tilletia horrida]KAK0561035.1 hypothetical protein OC861_006010 [Tilletia horrida]
MTSERYQFDLPEPPPGSYGNDLDPKESPHNVQKRPFDFPIEASLPGRTPAPSSKSGNTESEKRKGRVGMLTPYTVYLPQDYVSSIKLSPAQVHALDVGLGPVSMDHRWIGRLTFQEDGTAIVSCRRSWTNFPIFDFTFAPDDGEERSSTEKVSSSDTEGQGDAEKSNGSTFPPTRFPRMKLVSLIREINPDRYKKAPCQPSSAPGTVSEQQRLIEVAKAELDDAMPTLRLVLRMRTDFDAGTY